MFYNDVNIFGTSYFKHPDFIEWFDLNSNLDNIFEILSSKYFLDDCLLCLCILIIALKIFFVRIHNQDFFLLLFIFVFHGQYLYLYDQIHQLLLKVSSHENKDQFYSIRLFYKMT